MKGGLLPKRREDRWFMEVKKKHKVFRKSMRRHILLITNHGCHAPKIDVTTDTGGQNFYVNDFAHALVKLGYKISMLNRGGYLHPVTGKCHRGIVYYDDIWGKWGIYCRVLYLEDENKSFIEKEKLKTGGLEQEKDFFLSMARRIGLDVGGVYFINSHYWDGGVLGLLINEELENRYGVRLPHLWTPHSLGILKKENYRRASRKAAEALNFPSRISHEERIISEVDGVVSTSNKINMTLSNEYQSRVPNHLWFPPGVDTAVFKPRTINRCQKGLKVLEEKLGLTEEESANLVKTRIIFIEAGRTTKSKQKDTVLRAFSRIEGGDRALLVMNVDPQGDGYQRIQKVHASLKDKGNILLIYEYLPEETLAEILSFSNVYVSASVMEGWGMAVQEAAASKCAIISSKYVPFATEALGDSVLIVNKNHARLYAEKMDMMINEPNLRQRLANMCYKRVSAEYSWGALTRTLLKEMKKRRMIS